MERILLILTGILLYVQYGHAQQRQTWVEDFNGALPPTGWQVSSSSLSGSWQSNTTYHQSDSSVTNSQAYRGKVPNDPGDSIILTTPSYDCTNFDYVYLRFSHICKVSPQDNVRIEYRTNGMGNWNPLPGGIFYLGTATNYNSAKGFNSSSYPEWRADDSTVLPDQSWWREELFDLTAVASIAQVEFRFIIKHGSIQGTQVSYGWLLDKFSLDAAKYEIFPPTVEFIKPYVKDTMYSVGPYEINAKVKTNTTAPIKISYLKWTTDKIMYDSVPMTMVQGDSLWKGTIPQHPLGTIVTYAIMGVDSFGNTAAAFSEYVITTVVGSSEGKDVIIQSDGTISISQSPFIHDYGYSRCMLIYPFDEINPQARGTVTSIALRIAQAGSGAFPAKIYIKTVPVEKRSWSTTDDNYDWAIATQDATLVYDGMLGFTTTGWVDIPLQQSFLYTRQENLVVLFEQNCGGSSCKNSGHMGNVPSYYHKVTPEARQWMRSSNTNPPSPGNLGIEPRSADLRIHVVPVFSNTNSVTLKNILSPVQAKITTGQSMPVQVTIGNRGGNNLDSCLVNWSINGVLQPSYKWTGNLSWDYEDTLILGNYTVGVNRYDTIAVWVSMPNFQQDPITWDDTLITVLFNCNGPLAGDYIIGTGRDFPTVNEAIKVITLCGGSADIRLLLLSGVYTEPWDYRDCDLGSIMGNHILSLASEKASRDSVIVRPSSGVALRLGNTHNMGFEDITFDATAAGDNAIRIDRSCSNIVINNCSILADTNEFMSVSPLFIGLGTGQTIDNFRLTNSLVEGGDNNIVFQGGTNATAGNFSTNIVFDSNIFRNGSTCNVNIQYSHLTSFSHNKIYSKISHPEYQLGMWWFGVSMSYSNVENMTGNTFLQRTSNMNMDMNIKMPVGMMITDMNKLSVPTPKPMLMVNNEIMLPFIDDGFLGYGIFIGNSGTSNAPIHILHNSFRIGSSDYNTSDMGIYISDWTGSHVIKNNSIHTLSEGSYPIYLASVFDPGFIDIDANNMYAPNYIGYTGQTMASSIQEWQKEITTDQNATNIEPSYIDFSKSLELSNYTGLIYYRDSIVMQDIQGTTRGSITGVGCYAGQSPQVDAALGKILGMKRSGNTSAGQQDMVKVELFNGGLDPIVSVTLCWKINGVIQTSPAPWSGNLATGEKIEIPLGMLTYGYGENIIEAYICDLGSLTDLNHSNDTVKSSSCYVCRASLSGTYSIGGAPGPRNYADFNAFANVVDTCGATGTITLEFTGLYNGALDFATAADKLHGIPIIVTGVTGNDTIHASSGNAVTIGDKNRNITLKDIAIKVDAASARCIMITGACTNLVVRNCTLLASRTTIADGGCIYKGYGSGIWDNITIVGNRLDGGYYNASFYGGTNSTTPYPSLVVFDSNICTNAYQYGICTYYSNMRTAYNQISCRTSGNMTPSWHPVYYEYSNGDIIGNRIRALPSNMAKTGDIMYLNYVNYANVTAPMFVANNEIQYFGTNGSSNGIYIANAGTGSNAPLNIVHNSIYIEGGNRPCGIRVANMASPQYHCNIKNNTIHMLASEAYPVYLGFGVNIAAVDIDANNMYAPTNVGYAGVARTSIEAWQSFVTTDTRSVRFLPPYTDVSSGLALDDYDSLLCPQFPGSTDDLLKFSRKSITAMGAYTVPPLLSVDLRNSVITNVPNTVVQGQAITVKVNVACLGDTLIRNATFGWSFNGVTQTPPPIQIFTPALDRFETAEITLGTFIVQNPVTDIVVWIDQVNGRKDDNQLNDTARMVINRVSLAEFVAPFVEDVINKLSFDIFTNIYEHTGATASPPIMHIHATVNGMHQLYDSVTMRKEEGIWIATVPPLYYGSKVVYSLRVSDSIGNTIALTDSTHITIGLTQNYLYSSPSDSLAGIGNRGNVVTNSATAWSRSLYINSQITNHDRTKPVYLSGIAYRATTTGVARMVRIYMKATTQSTNPNAYLYPVIDTATLVYQGPILANDATWIDLPFTEKPFLLPAGHNLLVYVEEYGGTTSAITWRGSNIYKTGNYYGTVRSLGMSGTSACTPVTRFTVAEMEFYSGDNLAVFNMVSPVNDLAGLCISGFAPVKITLTNLSKNDYNFTANPTEVSARIINPFGHDTVYTKNINGGILLSGKTDTIEIVSAIPAMYAGQYDIKAWVNSPIDSIPYDDTIRYTYLSGSMGLPVDENFSGGNFPSQFVTQALIGTNTWMPYQPDTTVFPVKPQFGTGMLRYGGNQGTMARFSTRPLDMYGTMNPKLEFWYFHDTASTILDESYTDVKIVTDGVPRTVLSIPKKGNTYGWIQYTVYLSSYTGPTQCVYIEFVSTNDNKSGLQSEQYIDRIVITSDQDLAVREIIISPEIAACSLKNKDVYVVVRTMTNHAIDFSHYPTSLAVDVPGYPTFYDTLRGIRLGNTSDTILIASNIDLVPGISNIRAYLTGSIDYNQLNDTANLPLDISPAISLTAQSVSGGMNCLAKGDPVQQKVTVKNTGNIEIPGIELILNVMASSQQTITKSAGSLNPGDSTDILFDAYTAPGDAEYQVQIIGYMDCDSALANSSTPVEECVDIDDLTITRFIKPQEGETDTMGRSNEIAVYLKNLSDTRDYTGVVIAALIEVNGSQTASYRETVSRVGILDSTLYTFVATYTVPNETEYDIRVFISSIDNYPVNDTLLLTREAVDGDVGIRVDESGILTLQQNIPNPAGNSTAIRYSIPESGEVVFRIHSMNGQILYNRVIESESGDQSIKINTSGLASGIYMYSMEYKGQRIVKRMSVKR